MASSGLPGVNAPHPSLPARPPPSTIGAPPSSSSTTAAASASTYYGAAQPAATAGPQQPKLGYSRTYAPVGGAAAGTASTSSSGYQTGAYSYPQQPQTTAASYGPQYGAQQYGAVATASPQSYGPSAPHIQNPFPAQGLQQPTSYQQGYGSAGGGYRQNNNAGYGNWQGAAAASTTSAASYGPSYGPSHGTGQSAGYSAGGYGSNNYGPSYPAAPTTHGESSTDAQAAAQDGTAAPDGTADGKKKTHTVYRSGGGKTWTDDTLLEWDPNHPRLFVGNLAGEVTDDTLFKAFSKWRSVQKALVKRDKWTKKSRGYGFVSFSDADDFFQAAKEMNGKYIGSHPVVVRKSTTDIKAKTFKEEGGGDSRQHNKTNRNKKNYNKGDRGEGAAAAASNSGTSTPLGASGSGAAGSKQAYTPALGPVSSGVQKTKKKKNGLKLLG